MNEGSSCSISLDLVPEAILLLSSEGGVVEANRLALRLLDRSFDELRGLPFESLLADREHGALARWRAALADGEGGGLRLSLSLADGRKVEGRVSSDPSAQSFALILRDATPLEKEVEVLRTKELRLAQVEEIGRVGSFEWVEGETAQWSEQMFRLWGFDPAEPMPDIETALGRIHPDDLPRHLQSVDDTINEGHHHAIDVRVVHPDGTILYTETYAVMLEDGAEGPWRMVGIMRDVTERVLAEDERRRLSMAIDHADDMVMVTDQKGIIQYVNPSFERVTGYAREEAVGRNPSFLKSGRQDGAFYHSLWETILAGEVWRGTLENRRKDGSFYHEKMTVSPVTSSKEVVTGFVAIKRDATWEALLDKARSYFTAITSHELRTPLTKLEMVRVMGERIVLAEKKNPEENKRLRDVFDEAIADFKRIVETAGVLNRVVAMDEEAFVFFPLAPMVERLVGHCRELATQVRREVDISLAIDTAKPVVNGNSLLLERVIEEILSNAVKYTADGKRVAVRLHTEGERAILVVEDEGIGFAPTEGERLFDPYFSLEEVNRHRTDRYSHLGGGLGLGLTVARSVAEFHRGTLTIESLGVGRGAKATLTLPLATIP